MEIVATTSLPAVDRPNAARSCQFYPVGPIWLKFFSYMLPFCWILLCKVFKGHPLVPSVLVRYLFFPPIFSLAISDYLGSLVCISSKSDA